MLLGKGFCGWVFLMLLVVWWCGFGSLDLFMFLWLVLWFVGCWFVVGVERDVGLRGWEGCDFEGGVWGG